MGRPSSFMVPEHLAVTGDLAPLLQALLQDSRRRATREGWYPPTHPIVTWFADLDALAARGKAPAEVAPTPVWIKTCDAATLLGITPRAMLNRSRHITNRKIGNDRVWLQSDVMALVELER